VKTVTPLSADLVLVGGGHAHALVLRQFAMRPVEGLRITLVSPSSHTPYSGMLPGLVAGHYSFEEAHIDLERLCAWAGVRFVCAAATALDPHARRLRLDGRPAIAYDLLSLDIGSQPDLDSVPGARQYAIPVKPVASLWQRWQALENSLARGERVAVVGGGAGSVELILAMAHPLAGRQVSFDLYCGASTILADYNVRARRSVERALERAGITVHCNSRVEAVGPNELTLPNGRTGQFDHLYWCTAAASSPWLAASGLATDERGFLAVRDTLQSLDDDRVFAAGDCATQLNHPRPKAGVFAVRQGPVLADNLRASLLGQSLRNYRPQRRFLSLLSLGGKNATADRGTLSVTGDWVWRWKDRIDRTFMTRFSELPAMGNVHSLDRLPAAEDDEQAPCGGCGAKVGARSLASTLGQLAEEYPGVAAASEPGDDVARLAVSESVIYQSVDVLRSMVADPWLMGKIAANHALSDLYASGVRPGAAQALVTLPYASASLLQRDLYQLLSGALAVLAAADCPLSGGHSMQGPEAQLGFALTGVAMRGDGATLVKQGLNSGDRLILTKPLGTGVLFAAHMQQRADGRHIQAAIDAMLQSNAAAAGVAIDQALQCATDITGFGLLGHIGEMLQAQQGVRIDLSSLPALPGAIEATLAGIRSTLYAENLEACSSLLATPLPEGPEAALLFDPQTSGGLLLAVDARSCAELLAALEQAGCAGTCIGEVTESGRAEFA